MSTVAYWVAAGPSVTIKHSFEKRSLDVVDESLSLSPNLSSSSISSSDKKGNRTLNADRNLARPCVWHLHADCLFCAWLGYKKDVLHHLLCREGVCPTAWARLPCVKAGPHVMVPVTGQQLGNGLFISPQASLLSPAPAAFLCFLQLSYALPEASHGCRDTAMHSSP